MNTSFSTQPTQRTKLSALNRNQAAALLDMSPGSLSKLIDCGILPEVLTWESVAAIGSMATLVVDEGEATVVRQGRPGKPGADFDTRSILGFHTTMSDAELSEASLGWWRCAPQRVFDSGVLLVTVAHVVVAVFELKLGPEGQMFDAGEEGWAGRYRFYGDLVARLTTDGWVGDATWTALGQTRAFTNSGGPIAYLPDAA